MIDDQQRPVISLSSTIHDHDIDTETRTTSSSLSSRVSPHHTAMMNSSASAATINRRRHYNDIDDDHDGHGCTLRSRARSIAIITIMAIGLLTTIYIMVSSSSSSSSSSSRHLSAVIPPHDVVLPSSAPPLIAPSSAASMNVSHHSVTRSSDRLVMVPLLVGGLNNQIICLQEVVKIAVALNATLCWPLVKLDGLNKTAATMRPFDALFDRKYFATHALTRYGLHMASHVDDIRMCDITFDIQYSGINQYDVCRKYGINDTKSCDNITESIQSFPEVPYTPDEYRAHYAKGSRMVYLKRVFLQWFNRIRESSVAPRISMINDNVIRPSLSLQPAIDRVLHYYDQMMIRSNNSYTIGIHLRVESDLAAGGRATWCGKPPAIVSRVCDELHVNCEKAICMIATGAPRNEWIISLSNKCRHVITKEDAWTTTTSNDIIPIWSREEAAMIDMWTVTRTHLFVGCSMSTMSIAAIDLQPIRFNHWIHNNRTTTNVPAMSSSAVPIAAVTAATMARTISGDDIGGIMYGGKSWTTDCFSQNIKWIAHHRHAIDDVPCSRHIRV